MNNVRLIAITKPVADDIKDMTPEQFIAYCAKVSNPTNQLNTGTTDRLLKYCAKNKHWSIFEMCTIILEIKTTRDIGRQILRHRSFSFQEFSQRYAEVAEFTSPREIRWQDTKNRQNSIDFKTASEGDLQTASILRDDWFGRQQAIIDTVKDFYAWAIKNNVAKEVARAILPEGLTPTHLYMSGTLRSWIHYCDLRMGNGTQKEHQEIAKECWKVITKEIPALKDILPGLVYDDFGNIKKEEKEEGNKSNDAATTTKTDIPESIRTIHHEDYYIPINSD